MKNKIYLSVAVIAIIGLFNCSAFALDLIGPANNALEAGHIYAGFGYSYSEMDLKESALGISNNLKGVESHRVMYNMVYGITDDWQIYARVGAANSEFAEGARMFYGDYGPGYGLGSKITFSKDERVSWSCLFQFSRSEIEDEGSFNLSTFGLGTASTDVELDLYETQIAIGPTYEMQGWRIYGGPFLHLIEGQIDYEAFGLSTDIDEKFNFGGYIGTQIDLTEKSSFYVEYQVTSDAYAIGAGINWLF